MIPPGRLLFFCLLIPLLAGLTSPAHAEQPRRGDPTINPKLVAAGFLDSHPDLLYRSRGLEAYGKQDHPEAFKQFRRAARYSDKPSQAIVAEMLWIGLGTERDRALAYVWMELAAERGYVTFSGKRDMYWQQLDTGERERAERERPGLWAEYADEVAEPRLAGALRRARSRMTGSRLGSSTSPLVVYIPGVGSIDGSEYYNPRYWDPELYREWQDSIWTDVRFGTVNVGVPEQVRDTATPEASGEPARDNVPKGHDPTDEPI